MPREVAPQIGTHAIDMNMELILRTPFHRIDGQSDRIGGSAERILVESTQPVAAVIGLPGRVLRGGNDLHLELLLQSERMRAADQAPVRLACCPVAELYWTIPQLLAHGAECIERVRRRYAPAASDGKDPE